MRKKRSYYYYINIKYSVLSKCIPALPIQVQIQPKIKYRNSLLTKNVLREQRLGFHVASLLKFNYVKRKNAGTVQITPELVFLLNSAPPPQHMK